MDLQADSFAKALLTTTGGVFFILNVAGTIALVLWKHHLEKARAADIAALESKIAQVREENMTRFSTLHARREEVLRDLCKHLNLAVEACLSTTTIGGDSSLGVALDRLRGLHGQIFDVAIYFDDAFCERWHTALSATEESLIRWQSLQAGISTESASERQERMRSFGEYLGTLKVLRRDLIQHCRVLIGTSATEPSTRPR